MQEILWQSALNELSPHAGVWIENNSIIGISAVISSCAQGKGIDMNYATQGADVSSASLDG